MRGSLWSFKGCYICFKSVNMLGVKYPKNDVLYADVTTLI